MTATQLAHWRPTGDELPPATTIDYLRANAERAPHAAALIVPIAASEEVRHVTHLELWDHVERGARALRARFAAGERLGIWAPNVAEWIASYLSAGRAGLQVVPLNPQFSIEESAGIVDESRCVGLLTVAVHRGRALVEDARAVATRVAGVRDVIDLAEWDALVAGAPTGELPEPEPEDIALIQYTSGTTGRPKGAMLSHRSIAHAGWRSGHRLGLGPEDVYVNPFPLFHVGGTVGAIGVCAATGATLAPLPAFGVEAMVDLLDAAGATAAAGVPTVLQHLLPHLQARPDLAGRLRVVSTGAAPVSEQLVEQYAAMGVAISIAYGQTECSTICRTASTDGPRERATTVGQPVDGLEVAVFDVRSGAIVACDEVGELRVRGSNVMSGYLDRPEATAEVIDAAGWLHTGDLASMSPTGHCRIVGRLREVIIRGGENVYPREVEDVLAGHPAVHEVAVVGRPDPVYGETVTAVVVLEDGHDADWEALARFAGERLASFKVPRRWEVVEALPRNAAGKVVKSRLAEPSTVE